MANFDLFIHQKSSTFPDSSLLSSAVFIFWSQSYDWRPLKENLKEEVYLNSFKKLG